MHIFEYLLSRYMRYQILLADYIMEKNPHFKKMCQFNLFISVSYYSIGNIVPLDVLRALCFIDNQSFDVEMTFLLGCSEIKVHVYLIGLHESIQSRALWLISSYSWTQIECRLLAWLVLSCLGSSWRQRIIQMIRSCWPQRHSCLCLAHWIFAVVLQQLLVNYALYIHIFILEAVYPFKGLNLHRQEFQLWL